jgi:hypothetical protein
MTISYRAGVYHVTSEGQLLQLLASLLARQELEFAQ